jgi:hypothetical protein
MRRPKRIIPLSLWNVFRNSSYTRFCTVIPPALINCGKATSTNFSLMLAAHSHKGKNVVAASNEIVSCLQNQSVILTPHSNIIHSSFLSHFFCFLPFFRVQSKAPIWKSLLKYSLIMCYVFSYLYRKLFRSTEQVCTGINLFVHVRFRVSFCREQSIRQVPHQLKFYSDIF